MKVNSIILTAIVLMAGCKTGIDVEDKPVITVSILPQKYLVQKIAGDSYKINVMIPPGMGHATYDPSPRQLNDLSKSKAYFMIGHIEFEKVWMKRILSINKSMPVYDLSTGIILISSDHDHANKGDGRAMVDPHIWLSPKALKIISRNIYEALIDITPSDSLLYKQNYSTFIIELDSLDAEMGKSLSQPGNRKFLIYHPALTYLARDYNLQQMPIEYEGKSPSPYYLDQLIILAKKENIRAVFIQEQFDIENAKVLAQEINGKIIKINPLDEDLLNQIMYITDQLVINLSNDKDQ